MKPILISVFSVGLLLLAAGCTLNEQEDEGSTSLDQSTQFEVPEPTPTIESSLSDQYDADQDAIRGADADVVHVRAVQSSDGSWTFHVTVLHPDTGWEDYADGWDVVTEEGDILKKSSDDAFTRLLLHPHENEQPFTRNQAGVVVPDGVTRLVVRAHDIVDGFGGAELTIDLSVASGAGFIVERE